MDVSLQLYSIKDETKKDFKSAVKKVGKIGYKGVEFAGYGDLTSDEIVKLLEDAGLYSVGSHCGLQFFLENFEETLAFNKAIGSKYIICPSAKVDTMEDINILVDALNSAAKIAAKDNIKIGYHNHDFEFQKIDGKYALDIIAEKTNDDVILEVDVFWVAYAGVDPIAYIEKWGKKVELVHLKQMAENKDNVDMADGIIDMEAVKNIAKYATYFIVEHEEYDKPVWDGITNDVEALKKI